MNLLLEETIKIWPVVSPLMKFSICVLEIWIHHWRPPSMDRLGQKYTFICRVYNISEIF